MGMGGGVRKMCVWQIGSLAKRDRFIDGLRNTSAREAPDEEKER